MTQEQQRQQDARYDANMKGVERARELLQARNAEPANLEQELGDQLQAHDAESANLEQQLGDLSEQVRSLPTGSGKDTRALKAYNNFEGI